MKGAEAGHREDMGFSSETQQLMASRGREIQEGVKSGKLMPVFVEGKLSHYESVTPAQVRAQEVSMDSIDVLG